MKTKIFLPLAILLCCIFFSCKKDSFSPEPVVVSNAATIEKLKAFYQSEANLTSLQENPKPDQGIPDWEKTLLSDGKYLVPLSVNARGSNDKYRSGKYLLLTEQGDSYKGEYIYVLQDKTKGGQPLNMQQVFGKLNSGIIGSLKTGSEYAIAKVDMGTGEADLKQGNHVRYQIQQTGARGGDTTIVVNNAPLDECEQNGGTVVEIEWWYQEYDDNGNLIYEEYVYSTYECWGSGGSGGGGGGTPPTPQEIAEAALNAAANTIVKTANMLDVTLEGDVYESGWTYRTRLYKWQYATFGIGNTAKAYSIDKGVQKRNGTRGSWQWHTLEHLSEGVEGFAIWPKDTNGEIDVLTTDAIMGTYNSKMNIYWMLTLTYTGYFSTNKYESDNSVMTFNVESAPLPGY